MQTPKLLLTIIMLSGGTSIFPLNAAASWTLFGLKDEAINTILPLDPGYGEDAIMVGTSKGIWYHEYGYKRYIWTGLPVYDMQMTAYNSIIAAAGNGSDSDGIYIGKVIAIAEPGNLWEFTLLVKCPRPTAVAFKQAPLKDSGCIGGEIFIGNVEGVKSVYLCNDSLHELTTLPCPPNPFGERCASLHVFSKDGLLYAGGNYDYRIVFAVAPRPSLLLKGSNELTEVKKLGVTSMTELSERYDTLLAVATTAQGIQVFNAGGFVSSISSPGGPVLSIVPFITEQSLSEDYLMMLAAATPSGVYLQRAPDVDPVWQKVGTIPGVPACLAQQQWKILWAGTDSGVYRYEHSTGVQRETALPEPESMRLQAIRSGHGNVIFAFTGIDAPDFSMSIFDLRGRCIRRIMRIGKSIAVNGIGSGMFLYKILRNNRTAATGSFVCQ